MSSGRSCGLCQRLLRYAQPQRFCISLPAFLLLLFLFLNIQQVKQRQGVERTHQQVHVQTGTDMPRDMAMERPDARIVAVVLHDEIPVRLQQLDVPPLRIIGVHHAPVPGAHALVEHIHVVPVQVHGVRDRGGVFDDEPDGRRVAVVVDVPFGVVGVGGVGGVCEQQHGGVVVGAEGGVVDGPEEVAGCVDGDADGEGEGCGWSRVGGYGVDGGGGGQGVVGALRCGVFPGGGVGCGIGGG